MINISNDDGSTGKGILIGMLSAFGSAGFVALIFAFIYFFKYTSRGRIILDRVGRPGQYDDEQAFAREEAEALEVMDDLQRAEYLRAKGMKGMKDEVCACLRISADECVLQHSYSTTHQKRCKPIYRCRNSWLYKRRACLPGNLSRNWRLPTALWKDGPRSNSSIPSAVFRAICPYRNRMRCIIGRLKYTTSPTHHSSA